MRLCVALGFPTRRALLAELTAPDLAEWQAYERVEGPVGGPRMDALVRFLALVGLRPRSAADVEAAEPAWWRSSEAAELVTDEEAAEAKREEIRAAMMGACQPRMQQ